MAIWVFGYGSIVHKQGFEVAERVEPAYINGYRRVWWQGSTDHRGTPEAPGRTVTLQECPNSRTWGVAFRLAGDEVEQAAVLAQLEWREKQYDVRRYVDVYRPHDPRGAPTVSGALVYIASPDTSRNRNYLGPASTEAIAAQIAAAAGPSGRNDEYLYKLADAMRQMGVHDPELCSLEDAVRALQFASTSAGAPSVQIAPSSAETVRSLASSSAVAGSPASSAAHGAAVFSSAAATAAAVVAASELRGAAGTVFTQPQQIAVQTGS